MTQRRINILITLLATLLFFVVFLDRIIDVNGPATSSIIFRPFSGGIDTKTVYGEGLYFIWPWNTIYKFNTREQMVEEVLHIVVNNGATIEVKVSYRYQPIVAQLPVIFRQFGIKYNEVFIHPEVVSSTREMLSSYTPQQIYTGLPQQVYRTSLDKARSKLLSGNIILSDLVITRIILPANVMASIDKKLQQQQLAEEYDFRIVVAEKERQIKVIEAEAIKMAADTIQAGLTPEYLQFKRIEALQNLSISPNAKTVVIPQGITTPVLINGQ